VFRSGWGILALGLLASGGSGFWNSVATYVLKVKDIRAADAERAEMKRQAAAERAAAQRAEAEARRREAEAEIEQPPR